MKTALITGVSGYLGSHLAKTLKQAGWKVIGLDKKHTTNRYIDLFHPCDINDSESLHILFDRVNIDVVFHLAGRIEVGESVKFPTVFWHNNTAGTNTLLDTMLYWGVKNIVYSSTAGVYKSKTEALTENDEVNPMNNPYAGSKYSAELAIKQSGVKHVIFRYFNLAGADPDGEMGECHEPETHLIPRILQNLNNFTIYGNDYDTLDGTCVRDYVHVSDIADAHLAAAEFLLNDNDSQTLNLGTGKGYSVQEIVNLVKEVTGEKVKFTFEPRREGDPPFLFADVSLAEKVLNYRPKHDIISIIQTAYNWEKREKDNE
jgi:UDP-glucose 4-epimerase